MQRFWSLLISLLLILILTSCQQHGQVTGDSYFLVKGYQAKLSTLDLTEVRAFPYFSEPFITVAKNKAGEQYAVLFHSLEKVDQVRLPVSYEDILTRLGTYGYDLKNPSHLANLFLFEIHQKMVWSYISDSGGLTVYFNDHGDILSDGPF